ncbi:hypothetical protein ACNQVK_00785 [Mycobacterium sp. 134]|uniref:hypothetical protein n=1 Tax=Mycobacterium sp. 134 TaxID=3400425 RepID=UPI003AAA2D23
MTDQLVDHHHDGQGSTGIGWYLRRDKPPWDALEELRHSGYCTVTRDGDIVELDFTELGRTTFT